MKRIVKNSRGDKRKVTDKQRAFVVEYCNNGFNATKAAIKAGYSAHTASVTGCETLAKPYIREEVDRYMSKKQDKAEITREYIIDLMLEIALKAEKDSDKVRSAELISKLKGFLGEKTINTTIFANIDDKKQRILRERAIDVESTAENVKGCKEKV